MQVLGIIPARGGSKGVPRKNVRPVAGRPLIAYTIDAAKGSRLLSSFVTSTDDEAIAKTAQSLGSPVLMRPSSLAMDDTPMVAVVQHAVQAIEAKQGPLDYVVILQPASPQRTASDIDAALDLLMEGQVDSVISVYQVHDHHPARMYRVVKGQLTPYDMESADRLRQNLSPVYHRNGAIYACRRRLLEESGSLIGPDTRPYLMPRERSLNIDDEFDLLVADLLLQHLSNQRTRVEGAHANSQR